MAADYTLVPESSEGDMTFPTQTDLSAKQYLFVKLNTSNLVVLAGANEKPLGILQNKPVGSATAEASAIVRLYGISKLKVSETITHSQFLTPTAAGLGEVCDAANEEYGAVSIGKANANDTMAVIIFRGEVTATDA